MGREVKLYDTTQKVAGLSYSINLKAIRGEFKTWIVTEFWFSTNLLIIMFYSRTNAFFFHFLVLFSHSSVWGWGVCIVGVWLILYPLGTWYSHNDVRQTVTVSQSILSSSSCFSETESKLGSQMCFVNQALLTVADLVRHIIVNVHSTRLQFLIYWIRWSM